MICIADSGSTKTDWWIVNPGDESRETFHTIGLNPFYVNSETVTQKVQEVLPAELAERVTQLYFYGSGCSSETRKDVIKQGLGHVFSGADINVYHDLLGAARACCQHDPGVASILGTGSNSCKYDGKNIIDNVSNLGFVLGDEGSGGHIGKELIRARSYREMPEEIQEDFDSTYDYSHEEMLISVYNRPLPNKYVASFAPFCTKHRHTEFVQQLLNRVFTSFITHHLLKYNAEDMTFHFLGSIAENYNEELKIAMQQNGLSIGRIISKPIDLLVRYHLDEHEV